MFQPIEVIIFTEGRIVPSLVSGSLFQLTPGFFQYVPGRLLSLPFYIWYRKVAWPGLIHLSLWPFLQGALIPFNEK